MGYTVLIRGLEPHLDGVRVPWLQRSPRSGKKTPSAALQSGSRLSAIPARVCSSVFTQKQQKPLGHYVAHTSSEILQCLVVAFICFVRRKQILNLTPPRDWIRVVFPDRPSLFLSIESFKCKITDRIRCPGGIVRGYCSVSV